jgi:hypothetical protein
VPGSTGQQAADSLGEDEDAEGRSESAQLFEEGVNEAEHDQMRQASRADEKSDIADCNRSAASAVFSANTMIEGKQMGMKIKTIVFWILWMGNNLTSQTVSGEDLEFELSPLILDGPDDLVLLCQTLDSIAPQKEQVPLLVTSQTKWWST